MKSPLFSASNSAGRRRTPDWVRHAFSLTLAASLFGAFASPSAHANSVASQQAVVVDAASTPVFFPIENVPLGRVGVFYTYQTAAENSPTGYSAAGLPAGLAIDPASGLISGTPTVDGTFMGTVSATNASGTGTATLTLVIRPPLPTVTIAPEIPSGYPAQGITPSFLLTRTGGTTEPLSVLVTIRGSAVTGVDYQVINVVKKFKPGKSTKRVRILAVDESGRGIEKKTVKLTLQPSADYNLGEGVVAKVKIFYTP